MKYVPGHNVQCSSCGWRGFRRVHRFEDDRATADPCPKCGAEVETASFGTRAA